MSLKKLFRNLELVIPITLGVIVLAGVALVAVAPQLEQLAAGFLEESPVLATPTPSPTIDPNAFVPKPNSYLSPIKQEAWQDFKNGIPDARLEKVAKLLESYQLDERQLEVVQFLFFMGRGFDKPFDEKNNIYYSSWHDYSFTYPKNWELFLGDPGRIGVLAPGTVWDPNRGYYNQEIIADVWFHAYCSDTSLKAPVPWKDKESFTKNMFAARREVYGYSPTSKRQDVDFLGNQAAFYIHFISLNQYDGVPKPYTLLVNEYYFQIDDTAYLFDTRYPEANEESFKNRLQRMMESFNPGQAPCNEYDQHFTKPTINEMLKKLYQEIYGE